MGNPTDGDRLRELAHVIRYEGIPRDTTVWCERLEGIAGRLDGIGGSQDGEDHACGSK